MNKLRKVILLTGASSGIGYETAVLLARKGHRVYGAARRVERMEPLRAFGIVPLRLDVTDEASMAACVAAVMEAEGRIDVLVNNAGYGSFGAIENVPLEEARRQLEVNVFGLARLTQLVLPHMRAQGSGTVVNVSSIAGNAVEALSDALRMEVKPFGIRVALIEPGGIKTDWGIIAADHLAASSAGTAYEKEALNEAATLRKAYSMRLLSKPTVIARVITRAASRRRPKVRYRTGLFSHSGVFLHAILPARWWDALMRAGGRKLL